MRPDYDKSGTLCQPGRFPTDAIDSPLEMDFFVRTADNLIPVEVKAGNTVSKSLRKLVESEKYDAIHSGIKLARANIGRSDSFLTIT